MVDLIEVLAFGVIGFISGFLVMLYALYKLEKDNFLENVIENVINDVSTNEELQKNLHMIGGMIGSGFKNGFGVPSSSGSPRNLKQLGIQILGDLFSGKSQLPVFPPSPSTPPTPSQPQDISIKKLSDKW